MLYLLYGDDVVGGKAKLSALVKSLQKKKPEASLIQFDEDTFDVSRLDELIGVQGLFEARCIVVLDRVISEKENRDAVLLRLSDIAESPNVVILFEESLDISTKKKLERWAEKVQLFEREKEKDRPFNVFSLTEALGSRDMTGLWSLYHKAKASGVSDEEIHGLLFWQVKCMLLSLREKSAQGAGLKPFVFNKAKSATKNYTQEELKVFARTLVELYHESRRGRHGLDTALERFILGLSATVRV